MRGFWGAITLVLTGVIIADLVANPTGLQVGLNGFGDILKSSYMAMSGGYTKGPGG